MLIDWTFGQGKRPETGLSFQSRVPREHNRNVYPRMEEADQLTKYFNEMRNEKSYLNRSIRDYSGSADEFESWKRNTIEVLKYTTLDPVLQVGSVIAKLTGEATMLNVEHIRTPEERAVSIIMCDKYKQRLIKIEDQQVQMRQQKAIELKQTYLETI